ncbi:MULTISPECIES: FxLYD domain-containing protein [Achromobacter]|uniref:FxLYD domain-containing protein n=1 Tax=Achromobacter TaxID=222 RepID=UPI001CC04420|nr:FxLYD domain-containing protein [Achromobacter mucicolens]MDH1523847.1 FxLYD domain-containing protein [Achromobacter mucicolens]UAN01018.1 FxLYD domain-containing protein [Achromobacter mucicolens]
MKKIILASIAVLACACAPAGAQSLAYGVTLGNVQAVRDSTRNVSTITGFLANQSERPVNSVLLTYVLYDAQNREVGRVSEDIVGPLAPGQIKVVKAITPLEFARVTPLDVAAR